MNPKNTYSALEKRLASYGAMSLAAAGFSAPLAQANTIVYTNTSNLAGNSTATGPVYFNPANGSLSATNFAFELFPSLTGSNPGTPSCSSPGQHMPGCMSSQVILEATGGNRVLAGSYTGEVVLTGVNGGTFTNGYNFVGLRLTNGDLGWAEVDVINYTDVALVGFAYDVVAGQSIGLGQTQNNFTIPGGGGGAAPEPGTLVLLALGATGVAALRRRNQNTPAAE